MAAKLVDLRLFFSNFLEALFIANSLMKKETITAAKPRVSIPEPKEAKHKNEQKHVLLKAK